MGTFLAYIRREHEPVAQYAHLLCMKKQGRQGDEQLPFSSLRLEKSQDASMLSFSPQENWLIVAKHDS